MINKSSSTDGQDEQTKAAQLADRIARLIEIGRHQPVRSVETPTMALLLAVYAEPDISQTDLPAKLGVQKQAVSRTVKHAVEAGWLTKKADAIDGRVNRLRLTPEGRTLTKRIMNVLGG